MAQLSPEVLDDLSLAERVGRAFHVLDSVAGFVSPLPMPDAIAAWYEYGNNPARRFDVHWKVIKSRFVEQTTVSYSMSEHTHITQPCCSFLLIDSLLHTLQSSLQGVTLGMVK